jgi:hypothetical protein
MNQPIWTFHDLVVDGNVFSSMSQPNNSLERTPPGVERTMGIDQRRRSVRSRWVAEI